MKTKSVKKKLPATAREQSMTQKRRASRLGIGKAVKSVPLKDQTRDRILQTAEKLFATRGYNNVSVRDIATAANANTALIGYYFTNKEGLLLDVYQRHSGPLVEERLRGLEAAQSFKGRERVAAIVEAFVRPALAQIGDKKGESFFRLRAVLSGENAEILEKIVSKNFDKSSSAFIDALCKELPHHTRAEVCWRFHFLLGAIYYTAAGPHRIYAFSNGACDPSDKEAVIKALVPFMTQAFYS